MSNAKLVLAVAAMIGGMVLLVSTLGRDVTDKMVGGGPWYSETEMERAAADRPDPDAGWGDDPADQSE